jgi:lipopolysaccharide biosynthesis regulator YciM
MRRLRNFLPFRKKPKSTLIAQLEGDSSSSKDTLAAIAELSQVVKNNPDAIEIYLALGNLYRSQGEIERAIHIRNTLIARPTLDPSFKAQALYELGLDYKRGGFLDRAEQTFDQARGIIGDDPALLEEQASLAASGRDFERAARYFGQLNKPIPQSHYLVEEAKALWQKDEQAKSEQLLKSALRIHPGSVEAWLEIMIRDYQQGQWDKLGNDFKKGLRKTEPHLRFILLEGLVQHLFQAYDTAEIFSPLLQDSAGQALLSVIRKQPPDILLFYYAAWIDLRIGNREEAISWLKQCTELDADFWPARLELLSLLADTQELSQELKDQLDFFLVRARQIKKFICTQCGLRRERLFFDCPRCRSWHSISFLKILTN